MKMKKISSVDEFISSQPAHTKKLLNQLRKLIKQTVPQAEETIGYHMPAYKLNGPLLYFYAYEKHIGFYPMPSAIKAFKTKLTGYKLSKGTIQLPLDKTLPVSLIKSIIKFRVEENLAKAKKKSSVVAKTDLQVCYRGHKYFKTKDCPACPQCAKDLTAKKNFLSVLTAPARRALENAGIRTPRQLSLKTKSEILTLHGVGKSALPKLKRMLKKYELDFKGEK